MNSQIEQELFEQDNQNCAYMELFVDGKESRFCSDIVDVIEKYDLPAYRFAKLMDIIKESVLNGVRINHNSLTKDDIINYDMYGNSDS